MKILIATTNIGKIKEFQEILNQKKIFEIFTLNDLKINEDVEETGNTFEENAQIKATFYNQLSRMPTISEDSGLAIDSLNGEPGIYSARYGGVNLSDNDRVELVLKKMSKIPIEERSARFISVICGVGFGSNTLFSRGELEGSISSSKQGSNGFGYDPIFSPIGDNATLATKEIDEKNKISHRRKSIEIFLNKLIKDKIV
ncbi:MAG: RdgB/HAM1 family non-canonical purine NTP pyrophosphatase [SAR202 cluster bacterium]|nr:RdgB/HAM1 family non-canonical purine NTP pyrophosphatase [SAR202 cluster bacterium]OUU76374.1 MAG: non-canonical purine NTP pyrophosphatase, RdgB/HAM1 family [Chloroflexi bacterium TMED70]RZP17569.1 MAG: RdgB/HAM1 family non-canonical purine NTP pyrophosphatase [Chloroflexota bacterium]|tara:strand:- start:2376 stop:2975 length:600 start_codon:yes stop_codon:yes gene_type:complete